MAQTTDFTNFGNERPNYFAGQYLLEDDFEIQHKYLSDRQRYHNQSLHISGIIEGLELTVIQDAKSVQIKSGSAINSSGDLIILKQDITFSDFKNLTDGLLYIQYAQDKQVQQQKDVPDSYTRWIEKPILGFATTIPENSVNLGKLTIAQNSITLDANVREYSGLSLPNSNSKALTLRSGGNINPNLAVLTGSLKIDGDLTVNSRGNSSFTGSLIVNGNVGIGTTEPGNYKLNVQGDQYISGNLTINSNVVGKNLSLAADNSKRGALFLAVTGDYNHVLYNNLSNIDNEGVWDGVKWNVFNGLNIRVGSGNSKSTALYINNTGNVAIGINNPGEYKLNVQGNQLIKGSLTVNGVITGNPVQLGGFTDADQDEWPKVTWYRDTSKNWDEGLIKHDSAKGVFKKAGYGIHLHQSREFGLWSTGLDALFAVEGQTGNTYIKGSLRIAGTIYAGGNPVAYENYEIYLRGSAFESSEGNITFLKIANIDLGMTNSRGLNTVILNANGTFKNKATHDIFGNPTLWNNWATWVNTIAATGDVIAVASYDALNIAPTGGSAETLLRSINAGRAFQSIPGRYPYTLLFIQGQSRCIEVLQPYQGSNAHLKTTYYQLLNLQNITQQELWQTPTFQNNWVNYDNTYNPVGYFKDSLGIVHLRGLVRSGTNNTTIFTLPVGYRPSNRELQAIQTFNNTIGRLDILTDGQVQVVLGNNGWVSLDGITFRAA
ncbi:hypothetical protein GNF10_16985 [Nostoc sp. UCD121]|uniref:hypothetical protein n=1 Tax=unclassified Nostoc TaxID=2593658 RepID=UPI00162A1D4C|nr:MULTISPECIES: hypothetical protein [unclassified Nostoc]MBC1224977.1 hypothetical protein [Nostoc sp. UCD120]MBC1277603.1 hypothetical protein [Nostoc sp. UCD121]MBC1296301.1 hypothetical protein [Nostoc sp. UCD122]